MPYELDLPAFLRARRWRVKLLDNEVEIETPHVTIFFKRQNWRVSLRDLQMMDPGRSWNEVPDEIRESIQGAHDELVVAWDEMFPINPVWSHKE